MENKRHRQLWSYGPYFKNSDDKETQKLFTDYKGRFRLTFIVLGLGAALTAFSFGSDVNEGGPDLSLLVPGAVFTLCSVPLYIKTNKLGRKTVNRYNTVIKER